MGNDVSIIGGIIIFFLAVGVCLPYVQSAFGDPVTNVGVQDLMDDTTVTSSNNDTICTPIFIGGAMITKCVSVESDQEVSGWDVLSSVGKMFFWTFGSIPLFIDLLVFLPIRILLGFLIWRAFRSGGG